MSKEAKVKAEIKKLLNTNYKRKIKIRLKELKTGGNSIYLDTWQKGKRQYEFLNLYLTGDTIRDAEAIRKAIMIRDKREQDIESNVFGTVPNWKAKADFIAYHKQMGDNKATYWQTTNAMLKDFFKSIQINQITERNLLDFKDQMLEKVNPNTARTYMTTVKAALNMAVRESIIPKSPATNVTIKAQEPERPRLTIQQVLDLEKTECDNPEVKRAFLFSCYTGLRYSDVKNLEWKHIDDGFISHRMKKTGRLVSIPLNRMAMDLIGTPGTGLVFRLPMHGQTIIYLKRWTQKAGIEKDITFHSARHTFATSAVEAGVPYYLVSIWLGHAQTGTTSIYVKTDRKFSREGMRILEDAFHEAKNPNECELS